MLPPPAAQCLAGSSCAGCSPLQCPDTVLCMQPWCQRRDRPVHPWAWTPLGKHGWLLHRVMLLAAPASPCSCTCFPQQCPSLGTQRVLTPYLLQLLPLLTGVNLCHHRLCHHRLCHHCLPAAATAPLFPVLLLFLCQLVLNPALGLTLGVFKNPDPALYACCGFSLFQPMATSKQRKK